MKPRRIDLGRLLWIAGIVFQLAWYVLLWSRYVSSSELKGADFISFYTAGVIARSHRISQVYDLQLQHDLQQNIVGAPIGAAEFLPFLHPPFLVPLQALTAVDDYAVAYWYWILVLLIFLAFASVILWYWLRGKGWERKTTAGAVLSAILFYPLFISILKGQDTAFLLLGVFLWLFGFERERDWVAGLGLSLTLIRPQIAILLAIPFLFRRRKIFVWFLLWAVLLLIYSVVLLGFDGTRSFISTLFVSANGEGYGLNQAGMFNLTGLLLRIAPRLDLNVIHAIGWGFFVLALIGICIVWILSKSPDDRLIALTVTLSLFAAPHLHFHDLALFLIPLFMLGLAMLRTGRLTVWHAATLPMLVSVVLLFADLWNPARFTIPYLLMATLLWLIWRLRMKDVAR